MKKLILSALALMLLVTTACKKSNDDNVTAAGSATVSATRYGFDGGTAGAFKSTKAGITEVSAAGITTFSVTAIRDGGTESITIILLKKAAVGKYILGPSQSNGGIIISKDYTKPGDAALNYSTDKSGAMQGGAEVNITKLDGTTVEGTFYIVAYNSTGKEAYAEQGSFSGKIQ